MAKNYVVAMGGTGARCVEAIVYLTAAGLLGDKNLQMLVIDPTDQNNFNSKQTAEFIGMYRRLCGAVRPQGQAKIDPARLFQVQINPDGDPVFWHNPSSPDRTVREAIHYVDLNDDAKKFVSMFYSEEDLNMKLDEGYRSRPNVGAATMNQDLKVTANDEKSGLKHFIERLRAEAGQQPSPRVFIAGSVFGGTGATGLPTFPRLIKELVNPPLQRNVQATNLGENVRFGCAMMTPYFTFPSHDPGSDHKGPAPDPAEHPLATKAVLIHYSQEHPPYQHIYKIGAPERVPTNDHHASGGEHQNNRPHYVEVVAALSARNFFSLPEPNLEEKRLHFADSLRNATDQGVGWSTLPVLANGEAQQVAVEQESLKQRLVAFTTFAYFYNNFLFPAIQSNKHRNATFYRNHFVGLPLRPNDTLLGDLANFCNRYLTWLIQVGKAITNPASVSSDRLFDFEALSGAVPDSLGHLTYLSSPPNGRSAYNRLLDDLNAAPVQGPRPPSAAGLLTCLLFSAVCKFCEENYRQKHARQETS